MQMVEVRPSVKEDIHLLSPYICNEDRRAAAAFHLSSLQALELSFLQSIEVYSAFLDGKIICMFGIIPLFGNKACIWFASSDEREKIPITVLRHSKAIVSKYLETYNSLENYILAGNEKLKSWLKWLGAEFDMPVITETGERFERFIIRKPS